MEFETNKLGLVSLDNADFLRIMECGKFTFFIENGFNTKNIARKIKGAKRIVICVQGTKNIVLDDVQNIVESISRNAGKNAEICWGANVGKREKLLVIAGW